jgi:hypothetical protein
MEFVGFLQHSIASNSNYVSVHKMSTISSVKYNHYKNRIDLLPDLIDTNLFPVKELEQVN